MPRIMAAVEGGELFHRVGSLMRRSERRQLESMALAIAPQALTGQLARGRLDGQRIQPGEESGYRFPLPGPHARADRRATSGLVHPARTLTETVAQRGLPGRDGLPRRPPSPQAEFVLSGTRGRSTLHGVGDARVVGLARPIRRSAISTRTERPRPVDEACRVTARPWRPPDPPSRRLLQTSPSHRLYRTAAFRPLAEKCRTRASRLASGLPTSVAGHPTRSGRAPKRTMTRPSRRAPS